MFVFKIKNHLLGYIILHLFLILLTLNYFIEALIIYQI